MVHAFYGSSETGGITFDAEGGAAERGTVGLTIPGVRVDVDEDGRVRVSGRALGIRRVPVADDRLEGGVFRTGASAASSRAASCAFSVAPMR